MGLVDLRTDLKSIKFGKDVVGGGNSNQPYVVRDIPEPATTVRVSVVASACTVPCPDTAIFENTF